MNPFYFRARFLTSALRLQDAPPDEGYETAFAGRSNAGKSSAINALTQQKNLARASKTPGRTQLLNFFALDDERRLVDLPGYGYAKAPGAVQRDWGRSMENYLSRRECLRGIFLLMDIRHPLTDYDRQMLEWCRHCRLPVHVALTKADKLGRGAAKGVLLKVQAELKRDAAGLDFSIQLFSVPDRLGLDEAHRVLDHWLGMTKSVAELP